MCDLLPEAFSQLAGLFGLEVGGDACHGGVKLGDEGEDLVSKEIGEGCNFLWGSLLLDEFDLVVTVRLGEIG